MLQECRLAYIVRRDAEPCSNRIVHALAMAQREDTLSPCTWTGPRGDAVRKLDGRTEQVHGDSGPARARV
jgi:hypothetical protein